LLEWRTMVSLVLALAIVAQAGSPAASCPPPAPCVCICPDRAPAAPPPAPPADSDPTTSGPDGPAPDAPTAPATAAARADQPRWYGGPALAIDAGAFALMLGGAASNNGSLLIAGGAGFMLGAPIVHLANRRSSGALASLGLRVLGGGLATGIVMADVLSHPCDGEPSCQHDSSTAVALGAIALLGTALIDDLWLAREEGAGAAPRTSAKLGAAIVVGPQLALFSLGGSL
jgi:hypothetical protein